MKLASKVVIIDRKIIILLPLFKSVKQTVVYFGDLDRALVEEGSMMIVTNDHLICS
jgi:hypothetical protein